MTSFQGDFVSEEPVPVLREIKVPNVREFLLQCEKEGRIRIYQHQDRPGWIPPDDQDLVERAVAWSQQGQQVLPFIERHLPHLIPRIHSQLRDGTRSC